jgi:hypothetical protein
MMFAVAILEGSGLEDGLEPDIARAQQRLAVARMQESGAIAAAGGYVVDPERAQGCIDELSRILDQVRRPLMLAKQLVFDPPGTDEVSTNVARNGAIMAGRAEAYIRSWANQIQATRDALQGQLDTYREVDDGFMGRRV